MVGLSLQAFLAIIFGWKIASAGPAVTATFHSGKIELIGSDCDSLSREMGNLSAWKKRLGESAGVSERCTCEAGGKNCVLPVQSVIPEMVAEFYATKPSLDGPNCFNAALVFGKILPFLRNSRQEEMNFWLKSPLCRLKPASEELEPGDIGTIGSDPGDPLHAFVHVSQNLVFSKNGEFKNSAYLLQKPRDVFNTYEVTDECADWKNTPADCGQKIFYYSCNPLSAYLDQKSVAMPAQLQAASAEIDLVECEVSAKTLGGAVAPANLISDTRQILHVLRRLAAKEAKNGGHSSDEKLLWKSLAVRIDSNLTQIGYWENPPVPLPF